MGKITENDEKSIDSLNKDYLASLSLLLIKVDSNTIEIENIKNEKVEFIATLYCTGEEWTYSILKFITFQDGQKLEEWEEEDTGRYFKSWQMALKDYLIQTWSAELDYYIASNWY